MHANVSTSSLCLSVAQLVFFAPGWIRCTETTGQTILLFSLTNNDGAHHHSDCCKRSPALRCLLPHFMINKLVNSARTSCPALARNRMRNHRERRQPSREDPSLPVIMPCRFINAKHTSETPSAGAKCDPNGHHAQQYHALGRTEDLHAGPPTVFDGHSSIMVEK